MQYGVCRYTLFIGYFMRNTLLLLSEIQNVLKKSRTFVLITILMFITLLPYSNCTLVIVSRTQKD